MKHSADFEMFIQELRSSDGIVRERARTKLASIGKPAVPRLVVLLSDRNPQLRWEACKTLGTIPDADAARPLAMALSDESEAVRWVASEALIAHHRDALEPILQILEARFESPYVREAAYHVLRELERQNLLSKEEVVLLKLLHFPEPKISIAMAAHEALRVIRSSVPSL